MHIYAVCQGTAQTLKLSNSISGKMVIQTYLSQKKTICSACYNSHLLIVQDADSRSTDSELEELLSSQQVPALWSESYPFHIAEALKEVISRVGGVLLKKLAVLLPNVYRCFLIQVRKITTMSRK